MKVIISYFLRNTATKIRKGDVRNTVLRQIKNLRHSLVLLNQGITIKENEIIEHKEKPKKIKKLKKQVSIINRGLRHIQKAIEKLEEYKKAII